MRESALADPTYRRLFAAHVTSLAGTGLATVALALLAYELAEDDAGIVLGTALALKMVAYVGIAPLVGAFADRLPRKGFLITLDLVRAGIVALIPLASEPWHIYALVFALNAGSAGFTPTFQATIPDVLPDDARYTRALSLSRLAYDLENLASPALAALLLLVMSYDALFAANAITFLLSAVLIAPLTLPTTRVMDQPSGWRRVPFGLTAYLRTPRLKGLLALSAATAFGGAMVIVNTVVYVRGEFGGSEVDTAVTLMAFGAGSMVIALALPAYLDRFSDRVPMLTGGFLISAALALTPVLTPSLGVVWFFLGAGMSLVQTPGGRLLKRSSLASDRASLFAAHFALSHARWLVAYPLAGWLGNTDPGVTPVVLAVLCLVSSLTAYAVWPREDSVSLTHTHEAHRHEHPHTHDHHHHQHEHEHEHEHDPDISERPHVHRHHHPAVTHEHEFVIDQHHPHWPR